MCKAKSQIRCSKIISFHVNLCNFRRFLKTIWQICSSKVKFRENCLSLQLNSSTGKRELNSNTIRSVVIIIIVVLKCFFTLDNQNVNTSNQRMMYEVIPPPNSTFLFIMRRKNFASEDTQFHFVQLSGQVSQSWLRNYFAGLPERTLAMLTMCQFCMDIQRQQSLCPW